MAFNTHVQKLHQQPSPPRIGPLRQTSTASNDSSIYSGYSDPSLLSRTSTLTSSSSSVGQRSTSGHKRGLSEANMLATREHTESVRVSSVSPYKTARQSLRPLPQPPSSHLRSQRQTKIKSEDLSKSPAAHPRESDHVKSPLPIGLHTSGQSHTEPLYQNGETCTPQPPAGYEQQGATRIHNHSTITAPDLAELKFSSTSQLRTLSKLTQASTDESFSISAATPSVVGLRGRRQLKRNDSIRRDGKQMNVRGGGAWTGRNWMDQQRQFLQAYEYLCHIGEAKEWIEDIIHKPIPPIVQLEEALRDGVTLAEIVQALNPDRNIRIFHHPKLQFRHSDNIAVFFRFLAEIELPELFRFELIDLYEKKNIPKVIYCIHALSWLLYRNGMVGFRIGNLVGQLQFEHHELEEMQKGLDKAGVSMPSFSGMGATFGAEVEPEPEPIESEEDRVERELTENEYAILDLQAQIRGCMLRLRLGQTMQGLWDTEQQLIDLQSRIRGDWARQISDYRLSMKRFAVDLQSATRGFIFRSNHHDRKIQWADQEPHIIVLQSLVRARKFRQEWQDFHSLIERESASIQALQALWRGTRMRDQVDEQLESASHTTMNVERLQGAIRGSLERRNRQTQAVELQASTVSVTSFQSFVRGSATRQHQNRQQHALQTKSAIYRAFQATARGSLCRKSVANIRQQLNQSQEAIVHIQSLTRARSIQKELQKLRSDLRGGTGATIILQAATRGFATRACARNIKEHLRRHESLLRTLQSHVRGNLFRRSMATIMSDLRSNTAEISQLQALSRALLLRSDIGYTLDQVEDEEPAIVALQAATRALLVRTRFAEKKRFFKQNMDKVIKVQSFVRAKQQGQAYKSLTSGKNPPVGTVKNFVHLLNDSDFDFDEEIEFERLRKSVVQHVRQNELADQYITQLDIKIALLVKNKITLDEVVKHQKHFGGSVGSLLTNNEMISHDPFDLKALNKNSRRKLEHYQELFFMLQTQPQYLARLFKKIREQATPEKDCERTKHLVMGLFGYAQKRREEYYLIKLITRSIKEEIGGCRSLQDYLRGNFFWQKIFAAYTKSPKDRKFLRDVLGPLLTENIIDNADCDLESDPMAIYLNAIENEQLRTGRPSQRKPDIPREEAIRDPETKGLFIAHLQDLRDVVDQIFGALEDLLHKMPYGIRYIAQQMLQYLTSKFPNEDPNHLLQIAGHWIWKGYLQPALLEPDKYGVIDRGISGDQKRNLGEVVKVLGQIASGRLFGKENIFLNPLNSYVGDAISRLTDIWRSLIDVPNAETHFDIDEFNDLYAKTKPTLYIKMTDIFAIHKIVAADVSTICPSQDDILRDIIRELGSAKTNENELMGVSSSPEICLTLNPKLHDLEDPDAEVKALFMETKRCILYIIRVQSGPNLMDIMVRPITREDEIRWKNLVRDELSATSRRKGAYSDANTLIDIASLSCSDLKRTALENILRLEDLGRLSRHNHYQDILNAIAVDIRTKHRRRVQRTKELEGVRLTLDRLNDQASYLDQQLKTYNDYIEQAMVTLQNKKGKKRFLMPFTKQWNHEHELQRSGRVPKFGSFKYSASELANRGILIGWQGYPERQWTQLDLTISSNEVGVFSIEGSSGSISIPGATAQVPLDDLLQAQYNGTQSLEFFGDEKVRVNVNLFLHLIMRKFYKDRDG